MPLSLYQSSVPVFERSLTAFLAILDKAEAHAKARKFDPANYLSMRLAPDMFPLTRQIQTFCDHAKNASFRLAGETPPVIEDKETTFAELRARIEATLGHLKTVDAKAIDAGADREVVVPIGPNTRVKIARRELSHAFRPAEFLFPPDDGLRHSALRRRRDRQARFPWRRARRLSGLSGDPPT